MIISCNTPILVYGYGIRGKAICSVLTSYNLKVEAYIDREAEKYMDDMFGIYKLDDFCSTRENVGQYIVFIAVSNVFKHKQIAQELHSRGFCYIIYKELNSGQFADQINLLFDRTLNVIHTESIEGENVPEYKEFSNGKGDKFTEKLCDFAVPVNLLFGLTEKCYEDSLSYKETELRKVITDKSILYYTLVKGMMHYFDGEIRKEDWIRQRDLFLECRDSQIYSDNSRSCLQEQNKSIEDRYNIYIEMDNLLAENPRFFYDNPITVRWNSKGYFNIEDGNNRAAFLLQKGFRRLPCRMKREDYCKWLNDNSKIEYLKSCLEEKKVLLKAPISHPEFVNYFTKYSAYAYIKLQSVCDFMWQNSIDPFNKNFLEINTQNDWCGQHMARMGGNLVSVNDGIWDKINRAINELLYIKKVSYMNDMLRIPKIFYEIVFCNVITDSILNILAQLDFSYLICEFVDLSLEKVKENMIQLKCTNYSIMREQLVENKVYSIVSFSR